MKGHGKGKDLGGGAFGKDTFYIEDVTLYSSLSGLRSKRHRSVTFTFLFFLSHAFVRSFF